MKQFSSQVKCNLEQNQAQRTFLIIWGVAFCTMTTSESRHYGEWALSSWYDILPGPDRLLEISTSLSEDDAWLAAHNWCSKLLTPGIDSEKLQSITDALISNHWNQAKRMGCLGVQFTYINGFYHRFIWRASWLKCSVNECSQPVK